MLVRLLREISVGLRYDAQPWLGSDLMLGIGCLTLVVSGGILRIGVQILRVMGQMLGVRCQMLGVRADVGSYGSDIGGLAVRCW